MKNKNIVRVVAIIIIMCFLVAISFLFSSTTVAVKAQDVPSPTPSPTPIDIKELELNHRKEVWMGALEWCESRGIKTALNAMDVDGTPSYGGFQFKPSTFWYFLKKYEFATSTTLTHTDYDTQRKLVRRMIDDPTVNFRNQFPDCVNKFIGLPPTR